MKTTVRVFSRERRERLLVLASVCLAGLIMPLSFTGPSVALTVIGRDFDAGVVALGWVMNAFIVGFGSVVMAAGALADELGRKRVFRWGLIGFGSIGASLSFAPTILSLDLLRAAQGVAAALAMAGGAASLAQEFEGPARTRAYSLLGTSFGVGLAFGPLWSGFLVEHFGWRTIFITGSALAFIAFAFAERYMRESRDPQASGIDWWGTASFTGMVLSLTFAIVEGPQKGWSSALVIGLFASAAMLMLLFILIERRRLHPMLDLALFRCRRFIGAQMLPIGTAFAFVVPLVLLPSRFIGIEGMGAGDAGVMMLPLCIPMAIVPFLGALLARQFSRGLLSGVGLVIAAGGLLWLSAAPAGAGSRYLIWPMLAIGIGTGLPWGLMDDLAVSVVPKERAGMATGVFATMRLTGEALALAIASALLVGFMQAHLQETLATHSPTVGQVPSMSTRITANALASGNLDHHAGLLLSRATMAGVYQHAFQQVLQVLAIITAFCAAGVFTTLRRRSSIRVAGASAKASRR